MEHVNFTKRPRLVLVAHRYMQNNQPLRRIYIIGGHHRVL
jgi:hypothetical protein